MEYRISVEPKSEVYRNLRVEVPHQVFESQYTKELKRAATQVSLKGFRAGKAPLNMVEKYYGGRIRGDIIDKLCRSGIDEAIQKHDLKVVGIENVKMEDPHHGGDGSDHHDHNHDLVFTAEVSVFPEPVIDGYKGLEYEVEIEEYSEKHLDDAIQELRDRFSKFEEALDRETVAAGDYVSVRVRAKVDGTYFVGSDTDEGVYDSGVLGEVDWPAGLQSGIIGMKREERKTIRAVLPDDFSRKELAGKEADYDVLCLTFGKRVMPELDDEFAKSAGRADSVEQLKENLKKQIAKRIESANKDRRFSAIVKALSEKSPFEVPQVMIDEDIRRRLFDMGILDPRKQESYNVGVQNLRGSFGEQATLRVRGSIVVARLIEQEKIEASADEVDQWLEARAKESDLSRERVNSIYSWPKDSERVSQLVINDKVLDLLFSSTKGKETVKREPLAA